MKRKQLYTLALLFATLQIFAQTYTYDNLNRLTKVVYNNGTTITYSFDALGNRLSKKVTGATLETYAITTSVTPSGSGMVTGGGSFALGTTIELNAIANAGYEFSKWSDGETDNPRTVIVENDMSYTAQFKESSTVTPDLLGDIVVDGKVDWQDLDALAYACVSNAQATQYTDLNGDGVLNILDITRLISMITSDNQNGLVKKVDGTTYCLYKQIVDKDDVHINGDGTSYCRTRLMLDVIKDSSKKTYEVGDYIYMNEDDFQACMVFNLQKREVIVFTNSKTSARNYGMDGYAYVSLLDKISFNKENVFTSANWGWYPYFVESDNQSYSLSHFSYAGYYQMQSERASDGTWSTNRIGSIRPDDASAKWRANDRMLVHKGPQIDNNGHQYVDLGLPSGTLWATCNVGALAPEEFGGYYAWGETDEKETYSWETYKWCDGTQPKVTNPSLTKYCDRGGYGALDGKITLELADDVAHIKWGGSWHIPTQEEVLELINNCESEWTNVNGVNGMTFKGVNGNSIFIPAAGYKKNAKYYTGEGQYWTTSLGNHSTSIPYLEFLKSGIETYEGDLYSTQRYSGFSIRPVLSEYTPAVHRIEAPSSYRNHNLIDLGLPSGTLWATTNLGASSPEGYGCYYSWGEISGSCDGKKAFGLDNYPVDKTELIEPGEDLAISNDAANNKWGGEWRMPTLSEFKELINTKYTTSEWTTEKGVNGYRITSIVKGFEGNSIFLPAAGLYWDSTPRKVGEGGDYWTSTLYGDHDVANNVGYVYFDSSHITWWEEEPWYGLPIRPVVSLDAIE